jgi:hypothetical protein
MSSCSSWYGVTQAAGKELRSTVTRKEAIIILRNVLLCVLCKGNWGTCASINIACLSLAYAQSQQCAQSPHGILGEDVMADAYAEEPSWRCTKWALGTAARCMRKRMDGSRAGLDLKPACFGPDGDGNEFYYQVSDAPISQIPPLNPNRTHTRSTAPSVTTHYR